jgi:hypothetical protein
MKIALGFLCFCVALSSFAHDEFTVLQRKENNLGTFFQKVKLTDLESTDSFEGKYFTIVKSKSNEAIKFDDEDKELVKKAATVYHHLTKARSFWISHVKSDMPAKTAKVVVRLDITNLFDEQGHFANDKRSPQFNNALSIPGGQTPSWVPAEKQDKWEKEIWFRPKKVISTKDLPATGEPNPLTQVFEQVEPKLISYSQNKLTHSIFERIFYPTYASGSINRDLYIFAGTIAMSKAVLEVSKKMDPLFIEKWFYLDTAMVPEVIYHEYAHVMLSDHLAMSHSTPVNEGLADYFAAIMSGKRKVYAKVSGFSNSRPKDTQNKKPYGHWDEANRFATGDFVLAVLWDVRETLGEESADKVIYEARKTLQTETATISDHLLRAILNACDKVCQQPKIDKLKLYQTFSKRGF